MVKILTLRVKWCGECPYLDDDWCRNPIGDGFIDDVDGIPEWCPLQEEEENEL